MRVAVFGAYGKLGPCIVQELLNNEISVNAIGRTIRGMQWTDNTNVKEFEIDVTNEKADYSQALADVDIVVSTVGLTKYSETETAEQVDYQGNKNILRKAEDKGVKKFVYTSVIQADKHEEVPLVYSKYKFEQELQKSSLDWLIVRPTGYYYDIVNVFKPMVAKGTVNLLRDSKANIISHEDLAKFIVENLSTSKEILEVGGTKDYTYSELATIMFNKANKQPNIKYMPVALFNLLILLNKKKSDILKFSKWTMTRDLIGSIHYGNADFKEFVNSNE